MRIGEELTTEGLSRILEHEAGDLTCTVEAGIRLSELNAELERHGQRLSLDPPGDPTIGALLAQNRSGPLRHRFGAPRDLVLGVTLVLADGTVASAGGKVVKNVAGYDLARLVCGSRGRLALVARASFRLHPLPKASRTLVVETADAAVVVRTLLRSQLEPSALDVLHPGRVAVLFEGAPRAVETAARGGAGARRRKRVRQRGLAGVARPPGAGARTGPLRSGPPRRGPREPARSGRADLRRSGVHVTRDAKLQLVTSRTRRASATADRASGARFRPESDPRMSSEEGL